MFFEFQGKYCIVRTESAGVFAGEILAASASSASVIMINARRLWFWAGASSLSQLAQEGVKRPQECKFPCEVPRLALLGVIEILPATAVARESIDSVPVWAQ